MQRCIKFPCSDDFPEAITLLCQKNICQPNQLDNYGRTSLTFAISNGFSDCANALIECGANCNQGGTGAPPLIAATKQNNTAIMSNLIKHGANVNITDHEGKSPLFYAAKSAIGVSLLLEAGASPDIIEKTSGSTPLMVACVEGFDKVVSVMVEKAKLINIQDKFGHTALTYSATQGHTVSIRDLLRHGADVRVQDINGRSILALASIHGQLNSVITLLQESYLVPFSESFALSPIFMAIQ